MRAAPVLVILAVAALGGAGFLYWQNSRAGQLPAGLATANGRMEVERVDIATKLAGRLAQVRVREGDRVPSGAVVATMDETELRAQLAAAKASVRRAEQGVAQAQAEVAVRQAEYRLSGIELRRVQELARTSAAPAMEVDRRRAQNDVNRATMDAAQAAVGDAEAAVEAAQAQVAQIEANLKEMVLYAPMAGRIEYRLAHPGEVLGAGGRVVTLLDLSDVYMTIFLPTSQAGRVAYGSEARIVLDAAPTYVIPARVSFVAAEAQFTPKTVETSDEREKLMYRVKLSVAPQLLETYRDYVRAGLTGQGYVLTEEDAVWPERLAIRLPPEPPARAAP